MNLNDKLLNKIEPHELHEYCWRILDNQTDTQILNHGLKWSEWILKKDQYYVHYLLNLEYLIKLEKYEEAIKAIGNLEKIEVESEEKEFKKDLERLKKICLKNLPASN